MTLYYIEEKEHRGYIRQYDAKSKDFWNAYSELMSYAKAWNIKFFMVSQNKPIVNKDGSLSYNGCLFCNYSDCFHQVY